MHAGVSVHKGAPHATAGSGDARVIAQAQPAATDAANAPGATQNDQSGIPWWVWLLAAIVIIGIVYYFMSRRRREPVITTSAKGRGNDPDITTRK